MADSVSPMPESADADSALKCYMSVVRSLTAGLFRIWAAEAASIRLRLACFEFNKAGRPGLDGPGAKSLQHIAKIPFDTFDAWSYVTDVSHLVYATTLLDTFLSDTTVFLFLLFPGSMGTNHQVPLRKILDLRSRNEVITQAAMSRMREVSYLPFAARVQFLEQTFGLKITLGAEEYDALNHYTSIRNAAVHDQGSFELSLDENGHPVSRRKTCLAHPTPMDVDDVSKAIKAYERVATAVALAVCCQVLKQPDHPLVKGLLRRAEGRPEDLPPKVGP